uniref:Uncharacterized protein n=1 Tax=Grammatophora oceanica TaxID=210454 RepID=A0A7S1VGM1_9STRA
MVLALSRGLDREEDEFVEYRPISDYMGGHHAGKFDFDPRLSGVTSLNYEKSKVFGDAVAGRKKKCVAQLEDEGDELPSWATRSVQHKSSPASSATKDDTNEIHLKGTGTAEATITNKELSWEPFFARVETERGEVIANEDVSVSPSSGKLAPRGGSDPFSDRCTLSISRHTKEQIECSSTGRLHLVVRTEQTHWCWRVRGL